MQVNSGSRCSRSKLLHTAEILATSIFSSLLYCGFIVQITRDARNHCSYTYFNSFCYSCEGHLFYHFRQDIKIGRLPFYNLFNLPSMPSIEDFVKELSNSQISVDGPEAVFGKLFDYVGYGDIGGLFRPLVLSRLVAPGSKLKTVDYLWRYNGVAYDVSKIYRYLDKLCDRNPEKPDIKDLIEQITFAHNAKTMGGCIDVVIDEYRAETGALPPPQLSIASWIVAGHCVNAMFNLSTGRKVKFFPNFYFSSLMCENDSL